MNKEEKIKAIYKEMANKEKSFGCRYIAKHSKEGSKPFETRDVEDHFLSFEDGDYCYVDYLCDDSIRYDLVEVIGHPVMIGDVLDWIGEKEFNVNAKIPGFGFEDSKNLDNKSKLWLIQNHYSGIVCASWLNKRTSIEEQSDGCINYVYSLIGKG